MKFHTCFFIAVLALTASCSRNLNSGNYVSSSTSGTVLEGVIISARPVTISENDKLEGNGAGLLAGGIAGGVAGNQFGGGRGRTAATVGGVLAGAVLGSVIQSQLGESEGMEYIVKLDAANIGDYADIKKKEERTINSGSKKPSTSTINTNLKSEMISVIQGTDKIYAEGTPVYIIYSDDRPRLVAK